MRPKLTKTLVKAAIKGCDIFEKAGERNLTSAYACDFVNISEYTLPGWQGRWG